MKMLKEWGLKIGFLILISSIIGIAQEVQAAPRIPFNEHVGIEFDIKKYDGTPYKDAQVLVDLKEESSKPTVVNNFLEIGGVSTKDVLITSTNGHYVHNYGLFDMGSVFYYPPVWTDHSFHYAYYTNLRLLPGRHIKKLEVGDYYYLIKTWYYDKSYNYTKFVDNDRVLNSPSQKIVSLANGAFLYKDENLLTGYHDRPQVEFGGISMSTWRDESNTYQNTSTDTFGRNISFIVTPYQIKENYVDKSGNLITPPAGFTQGNLTDANEEQYTHTLTGLPTSYTSGGKTYKLKGSYKGATKPGTLSQSNPPSVTIDYTDSGVPDFDLESQITAVYSLSVKLTEKYIDEKGVQIEPAWNPSTPLDLDKGDTFTIPHIIGDIKVDNKGDAYEYIGWKYSTDSVGTKRTTATTGTINSDTTIQYIYRLAKTTASLDLKPMPQIVDNNDNVSWTSRLENTGGAPLKDLVLNATSNWSTGLTDPVQVTITPAGGSPQTITVNSGDWTSGVNLSGITIPNGGVNNYADITFTTTATGAVNQVLPAEIEVSGNISTPVKAYNFVRIDDPDEPNLKPTGNAGLINIPDFRFGEVEVKPYAQTKGLDAASYESGYNPYIRYMDNESTGIYTLSVKMSPFTSGSKTLPATTSIKLKDGVMKEVHNYNKHNESLSVGSSIGPMRIYSDNTTTIVHFGNTQGVYQLDYAFNDVELDLMAHSGIAGLSYQADMDWTLTTAP